MLTLHRISQDAHPIVLVSLAMILCPLEGLLLVWGVRLAARAVRILVRHPAALATIVLVFALAACAPQQVPPVAPAVAPQPGFALYTCSEEHFDARYVGGMAHLLLARAALDAPAPGRGASDLDAERIDGGALPGKVIARGHLDGVAPAALPPSAGRFSLPSVQRRAAREQARAQAAAGAMLSVARRQAHGFADSILGRSLTRGLAGADYGACLTGAAAFFLAHPAEEPYLYILGRLAPEGPQTPTGGVDLGHARVHLVFYCEQTATCPARLKTCERPLGGLHAGGIHVSPPEDLGVLPTPWKEQW